MKEFPANIPIDIENMLFDKEYSELNEYEKHSVSEFMSESEYARFRAIIRSTRRYYDNQPAITPAGDIRDSLINEFRKKHKKNKAQRGIFGLLGYPVPAYRAAAAMVTVIAALMFFDKDAVLDKGLTKTPDTIYVAKPAAVPDTVYKTTEVVKFIAARQKQTGRHEILLSDSAMPAPDYYNNNTASVVEAVRSQKYGTAFSDDEKYMKFLTIAN